MVSKVLVFYSILVSNCVMMAFSSNINNILKSRNMFSFDSISPNLVDTIAMGAQLAMDQCQTAFKWNRWNCPQSVFSRRSQLLSTKETAYSKAIVAAGIVHTITKNCSRGEIFGCGCNFHEDINTQKPSDILPQKDWMWGGCTDDPSFAVELSEEFLDGMEKGTDAQAYVNRHNYRIGREVVRQNMVMKCKCHGVSGSCQTQTCWKELAPFTEIARKLKERYQKAVRISFESVKGAVSIGNSARHAPSAEEAKNIEDSLVFLEKSPDYCKANARIDWLGMKGRSCTRTFLANASIAERRSCRNLCRSCGFKVKKYSKEVKRRCNCTFSWCCEVKCDTCTERVEEFFCD